MFTSTSWRGPLAALAGAALLATTGCAGTRERANAFASDCAYGSTILQASCVDLAPPRPEPTMATPVDANSSFMALVRTRAQGAPAVNAAFARWQAEEAAIEAFRAEMLPAASAFGEVGMRGSYGLATNTAPYTYGVRVSVPVFDGGRALNATDRQAALSVAARDAAIDELSATVLDLVAAAAAVQRADAVLASRRTLSGGLTQVFSAVESEITEGTLSRADADQVQVQRDGIAVEISSAERDRAQARQSFAEVAGTMPDNVGAIGSISRWLPTSRADALAIAADENPRINRIEALAAAADLDLQAVPGAFSPNVTFDVEAVASGDAMAGGSPEFDLQALVRFEMPISLGGGADATRRVRELELIAATAEISAARQGVAAGAEAAFDRLRLSQQSEAQARTALERARAVLSGIRTERNLGERSAFDEMSALNALSEAEIRLSGQVYERIVAEHLLAAQIGRIDEIYGVGIPGNML